MIATISSRGMSTPNAPVFSRGMNHAGAPLTIPRRASSGSQSRSTPSSPPQPDHVSVPVKVVIQQSTPPKETVLAIRCAPNSDSDSSSSSSVSDGTRSTIPSKHKRVRGVRSAVVCPPEQSTPTPAVHHARIARLAIGTKDEDSTPRPFKQSLIYTPGVSLRLQTEGLKSRNFTESHVRASTEPSAVPMPPQLIRKKSGQLVKPSLKSSSSLSVITRGISSKSEPNTPTHAKAVHFDAKLEHVKLFLAEQKPLAVSRDGSPTDDTSGTDSDFPSFIFGDGVSDGKSRMNLVMRVPNMPPTVNLNADVALEKLVLSSDTMSILGRIRVRNIAYAKWVAVRFTFDSWQTTSEVSAKYVESIDSDFDRFSFSIRLNDLLARIEEKQLYLAIKYIVADRELWDNNWGKNYFAEFTKIVPNAGRFRSKLKSSEDEESTAESDIADLQNKLEKVVQGREKAGPSLLTQSLSRDNMLASRYNFGASLKGPWKPMDLSSPPRHMRTRSYPSSMVTFTSTPNTIPWPEKAGNKAAFAIKTIPALGSPRDVSEDTLLSRLATDTKDLPSAVPGNQVFRNHQRGYFDDISIGNESPTKRTPLGTPSHGDQTPTASSRLYSFPPIEGLPSTPLYGLGLNTTTYIDSFDGSDQSTPSFASPSSGSQSSVTPSPTEKYMFYSLTRGSAEDRKASPGTDYRQFLNKFCFFTGSDKAGQLNVPVDPITRTQSASDIEDFLSSASPRLHASDCFTTPTRSPSFDDIIGARNGSVTPVSCMRSSPPHVSISSPIISEIRSVTPIAAI